MVYLIFAAAFLIRLIYIIQLKSTVFYSNFLLDEAFYNNWAMTIASGNWLGKETFSALPLYSYILGITYRLFGYNLFLPRLLESLLNSLSCMLIYVVTKKIFNKRAAAIAGFVASVYAPFIFYSGIIEGTTFVIFTYLLTTLVLLKAIENQKLAWFLLFGLILAIATLFRVGILLFKPAALLWTLIISKDRKRTVIGVIVAVFVALAVLLSITLRNYMVSRDVVFLTSHAGVNFYIGNNENADGTFKAPLWARSNIEGLRADSRSIAEKIHGRILKDSEVSAHYMNKALNFIKTRPANFVKLLWRKLLLFVNKQEIYDVAHYQTYRENIPILKFPFLGFLFIGPLGLAGAFVGIRRIKSLMPLYIFSITYTISIIIYFVNSRYRIPFATVMIIFCGFFVSWIIEKFRDRKIIPLLLASVLWAFFFIIVNLPTGVSTDATAYSNLGNLYMQAGEPDKAIEAFYKAMEFDPDDPKPYNDAGYLYLMQGELGKASGLIVNSLSRAPDYPFAHINLGLLSETQGDLAAAENEYNKTIRLNPNIAEAHNNLAGVYEKTDRRSLAIEEYRKAIELNPTNARTRYNLGVIYGRQGDLEKAKKEFEEAVRLDPNFKPAKDTLCYF